MNDSRHRLSEILKEHSAELRRRLAGKIPRRWRSALSVDDVMQQTYTDAFLNIDRFVPRGERAFAAWLFRIADRRLIDALRMLEADKRGTDHRRVQPKIHEDSILALYEMLGAAGTTPSQHAARNETRGLLDRAIQQLPEVYRQAVQMYDLDGQPIDEVAQLLGRSPGAVHMVRARAHERLRELMGSDSKYFTKP